MTESSTSNAPAPRWSATATVLGATALTAATLVGGGLLVLEVRDIDQARERVATALQQTEDAQRALAVATGRQRTLTTEVTDLEARRAALQPEVARYEEQRAKLASMEQTFAGLEQSIAERTSVQQAAIAKAVESVKRADKAVEQANQAQSRREQISAELATSEREMAALAEVRKAATESRTSAAAAEQARRLDEDKVAILRIEFEQLTVALRVLRAEQEKLATAATEGVDARLTTARATEAKVKESIATLTVQQERLTAAIGPLTKELAGLETQQATQAQSKARADVATARVAALLQQEKTLVGAIETLTQRAADLTKALGSQGEIQTAITLGLSKVTELSNKADALRTDVASLENRREVQVAAESKAVEARQRESAIVISIEQLQKREVELRSEVKRLEALRAESLPK